MESYGARVEKLNHLGIALSGEKDFNRLLESILLGAKELTYADAGTLYIKTDRDTLEFAIIRTDSLNMAMGGTTGVEIRFPELPLYVDGVANSKMVAAAAALQGVTITIPDAYTVAGYDFSGTRAFDQKNGYRSVSFLTVPMKNHDGEVIGVLQLINALDPATGSIVAFSAEAQHLAESLASQAAVAMTNQKLIRELEALFESFIQAIAGAIDDKSPYTARHCEKVPVLTEMLADAASCSDVGVLRQFRPTREELHELRVAAWLHDCGKVVTPEHIVDKSTKLECIFDRFQLLDLRCELIKKEWENERLRWRLQTLEQAADPDAVAARDEEYGRRLQQLDDDMHFLQTVNRGDDLMTAQRTERLQGIVNQYRWIDSNGQSREFISEEEMENLKVMRGTLTDRERKVINHHVVATKNMLSKLPFPKHLRRVPQLAGAHHETMNGSGYPDRLTREQIPIGARIMAIADVFEALTAADRPYKPAKSLSESMKILGFMAKNQQIDADLFQVFVDSQVYLEYAKRYLNPEQVDEVIPQKLPGYRNR
ncbi:MAG: GAF domain-containing protein [Magnetococcales bacterium]|nr:GAF domain-containing protein [Magnetococcales bacterium]